MYKILANLANAVFKFLYEICFYVYNNFSLRHTLSLNNIAKAVCFYMVIVASAIYWDFQLPSKHDPSKPTIALYSNYNRMGEKLLYERTFKAAENLGWNVYGALVVEQYSQNFFIRQVYNTATFILHQIYKPQFNLSLTHLTYLKPYGYNVVYLNVPNYLLYNLKGDNFDKSALFLKDFDAFADISSFTNGTNHTLIKVLKNNDKEKAPIIPVYIGHGELEYSVTKKHKMLLTGSLWGCNRNNSRIFEVIKRLADNNLLEAYGQSDYLEFLGDNYKGKVEEYRNPNIPNHDNDAKLIALQKKYGISLVLHTLEHMIENIPTSRISEAAASGALMIMDDLPFAKQHFKDNILYINTISNSKSIYDQIRSHMKWIRQNPDLANKKAKKAHEIWSANFALEKQLDFLYKQICGCQEKINK